MSTNSTGVQRTAVYKKHRITETLASNAFATSICFVFFDERFGITPGQPQHFAFVRVFMVIFVFAILSYAIKLWGLAKVIAVFAILYLGLPIVIAPLLDQVIQDLPTRFLCIRCVNVLLLIAPALAATSKSLSDGGAYSLSSIFRLINAVAISSILTFASKSKFDDSVLIFMLAFTTFQLVTLIFTIAFSRVAIAVLK